MVFKKPGWFATFYKLSKLEKTAIKFGKQTKKGKGRFRPEVKWRQISGRSRDQASRQAIHHKYPVLEVFVKYRILFIFDRIVIIWYFKLYNVFITRRQFQAANTKI